MFSIQDVREGSADSMNKPFETGPILIVEDDQDEAELARRVLKQVVPEQPVQFAVGDVDSLKFLFANDLVVCDLPSLVLLDLDLPQLDGAQLLERLRANESTKSIPVVVLTSSDNEADVRRCYEAGANAYVVKPNQLGEIRETIRAIALFWIGTNRTLKVAQ
ncbi:MAG: two-component system response regulator [Planctomycetota bacterium]|jgi:two-component system response regulator